MGAMLSPLFDFVLAGVDDDEVGSASGVLNAMQQLGGAIGIAVIGTLFFSASRARADSTSAFHEALLGRGRRARGRRRACQAAADARRERTDRAKLPEGSTPFTHVELAVRSTGYARAR